MSVLLALDRQVNDLSEARSLVSQVASAFRPSLCCPPTAAAAGCAPHSLETLRRLFPREAPTVISVTGKGLAGLEKLFSRLEKAMEWAQVETPFKEHGRLRLILAAGGMRAVVVDFYSSLEEDDAHLQPLSREQEVFVVAQLIEYFSSGERVGCALSRARAARLLETLRAQEVGGGVDSVASAWSYGLKRNRMVRFVREAQFADLGAPMVLARTLENSLTGEWSIKVGLPLGSLVTVPSEYVPTSTIDIGKLAALEQMDVVIAAHVKTPTRESVEIREEAVGEILSLPSDSLASWASVMWELRPEAADSPREPTSEGEFLEISIVAKRRRALQVLLESDAADDELRRLRRTLFEQIDTKLRVVQRD